MIGSGTVDRQFNCVKIIQLDGNPIDKTWEETIELALNSLDVVGTMKNYNEFAYKGFPFGFNMFDYQPLPDDVEPKALTLNDLECENPVKVKIWPHVFIGVDTRESCGKLLAAVKKGLDCMQVPNTSFGVTSTACFISLIVNNKIENI